jgi:hypothetical protein
VASERDHRVFYEDQSMVYVVYLFLSLVFKNVFEIFLAPLDGLKSVKNKMSGNFQVRSQEIL